MAGRGRRRTSCCIQETKLTDADAPVMAFAMAGYQLVHHGEGRWNGVAIAARQGLADRRTSSPTSATGRSATRGRAGPAPRPPARTTSTRSTRRGWSPRPWTGCAVVSLYAPNGRVVGLAVLRRQARLVRAARRAGSARRRRRATPLVLGGDLNVAPTDADVWDAAAVHGGTHVSRAGARRVPGAARLGPGRRATARRHDEPGRFSWWDYRAGNVPQELRDADRPPARRRRPSPRGSSTPRSTARRARARRSRRITRRCSIDLDEPGRPIDPGLGGRARPDQRPDEAAPLDRAAQAIACAGRSSR